MPHFISFSIQTAEFPLLKVLNSANDFCSQGYAIGSAALVSLALFGAYTVRAEITTVNILDPWTFTGLLVGAMLPYAFSAMTMKSVGIAANDMVEECMAQFPHIIEGTMEPQYKRCIEISTKASLHEMIAPGALVIISPVAAGMAFGKNCTAGLLAGALVSGIQLAISMSNSGGAWDNSKKYIEVGTSCCVWLRIPLPSGLLSQLDLQLKWFLTTALCLLLLLLLACVCGEFSLAPSALKTERVLTRTRTLSLEIPWETR